MSNLHVEFDTFSFYDRDDEYRVIRGCRLKQRQDLALCLQQLQEIALKSKAKTQATLYDKNIRFQKLANQVLGLCGVDPDWLDVNMVFRFILPYQDEQGNHFGLLHQINFPQTAISGKTSTVEEYIASTWLHAGSLHQALDLLGYKVGDLSQAQINQIITAKSLLSMTEEQRQQFEAEQELKEELNKMANQKTEESSPQPSGRFMTEKELGDLLTQVRK